MMRFSAILPVMLFTGNGNRQTSQHYYYHPAHYRNLPDFRTEKKQDLNSVFDPSAALRNDPETGADAKMLEKLKTLSSFTTGK